MSVISQNGDDRKKAAVDSMTISNKDKARDGNIVYSALQGTDRKRGHSHSNESLKFFRIP